MIKWKCHNCDIVFTSESEEDYIEETRQHISDCMEVNDFIQRI
jgi:hypothetical protein